jgi:glycosyltransferase involved in cell wall biosynthesis
MKVSIITVTYNSEKYLKTCIDSVLNQTYKNIEYIIIDGFSKDDTIKIINSYGSQIQKFISEPDLGLYDAINKGITISTGDIIGLLHSDDFLISNEIVDVIVKSFNDNIDCVYANSQFINKNNGFYTRFYYSGFFKENTIKYGLMPSHPTMYFRNSVLKKYSLYNLKYKIASDFDLIFRHYVLYKTRMHFINQTWVIMRDGGLSNKGIKSKLKISKEIFTILKSHKVQTNYLFVNFRYIYKLLTFFI